MVPFQWGFFVQIGAKFSQMVPFLLVNFYHFLKWYHFWWQFSSFSEMVPLLSRIVSTPGMVLLEPLLSQIFGTLQEW